MLLLNYLGVFLALSPWAKWSLLAKKGKECRQCHCQFLATTIQGGPLFNRYLMAQAVNDALNEGHCSALTGSPTFSGADGFTFDTWDDIGAQCDPTDNAVCNKQRASGMIWRLAFNGGKWARCRRDKGRKIEVKIYCTGCNSNSCYQKGAQYAGNYDESCFFDAKKLNSVNDVTCQT